MWLIAHAIQAFFWHQTISADAPTPAHCTQVLKLQPDQPMDQRDLSRFWC
jgi:hypothetical protein